MEVTKCGKFHIPRYKGLKVGIFRKNRILGTFGSSLNPYFTDGLSHPYHVDESMSFLGTSGVNFRFFFSFFDESLCGVISVAFVP